MREIPFSPEMMRSVMDNPAGIDGKPIEQNSNTDQIEKMKESLGLALSELTARQLEVIQLYFWENMTQEQIGKELGVRRDVVTRHLQRAISKLKRSKEFVKLHF